MVAIIGLVVCQDEESLSSYIGTPSQPDLNPGALVGMVSMVAIACYFGVVSTLNHQKTKVVT